MLLLLLAAEGAAVSVGGQWACLGSCMGAGDAVAADTQSGWAVRRHRLGGEAHVHWSCPALRSVCVRWQVP